LLVLKKSDMLRLGCSWRIPTAVLLLCYSLPLLSSAVHPSDSALQYIGRWDFANTSAPTFQWPASSISFTLECSSASSISATFDTHDTYTKFGVYLNDATALPYQLTKPGTSRIQAAIPSGKTVVSIVKTTEDFKADPAQGSHTMLQPPCVFRGLDIDDSICTISSSPRKERRMQFVGDSITCGFGNQVSNPIESGECGVAASHTAIDNVIQEILYQMEDTYESWSMQLARKFSADAHVQCLSGIGMCKNGIGILPHSDYNMTYFIDRAMPFTSPTASNRWDYSKYQPDVLVINLGTNDYIASTGPTAPTYASFQAHYVAFVTRLMQNYQASRTKIILACGPMTNRQCPYVEAAATILAKSFKTGYVNVSLTTGLSGCVGHPNQAQDTGMVNLMTPLVKKLTGW
jgi:lysophospholipase L1-like esterase